MIQRGCAPWDVLGRDEGIAFTEDLTVSTDATAILSPAVAGLHFFDDSLSQRKNYVNCDLVSSFPYTSCFWYLGREVCHASLYYIVVGINI